MNLENAHLELQVNATAFQWMAVHGQLCLALRHPGNTGYSREIVIDMVKLLSKLIVDAGLLTQEEMNEANQYETQAAGFEPGRKRN